MAFDWKTFNPDVIEEFRANRGVVARFGGLPLVILHTVGAKSGKVREVPLIVVPDDEGALLFGTAAGSKTHPDWYFNLKAHPRITVELGEETITADVVELAGDEARQKREAQARTSPQFAEYVASATPRVVPIFRIVPA